MYTFIKSALIFFLSLNLGLVSCGKKQPATVSYTIKSDTNWLVNPAADKPEVIDKLKRGEQVISTEKKVITTKEGNDLKQINYLSVYMNADPSKKGWIREADALEGKFDTSYVIRNTDLFKRPSEDSGKEWSNLQSGEKIMVLQKMDAKWSKVTVPYGSKLFEGYMLNEKIGSEEQVIKTVKLSGIGEVEINASTTYSATGGDKLVFGVRKLFDQNLLTSWCEGVEDGEGIDESIEMKFPNKILISSVEIVNGYTKSEEDYKMTNRIKKMAWETYDADGNRMASGDCEFKDEVYDFQTCGISSSVTINKIKLIIREIYKGEKYPKSTCFSEIKLMKAN